MSDFSITNHRFNETTFPIQKEEVKKKNLIQKAGSLAQKTASLGLTFIKKLGKSIAEKPKKIKNTFSKFFTWKEIRNKHETKLASKIVSSKTSEKIKNMQKEFPQVKNLFQSVEQNNTNLDFLKEKIHETIQEIENQPVSQKKKERSKKKVLSYLNFIEKRIGTARKELENLMEDERKTWRREALSTTTTVLGILSGGDLILESFGALESAFETTVEGSAEAENITEASEASESDNTTLSEEEIEGFAFSYDAAIHSLTSLPENLGDLFEESAKEIIGNLNEQWNTISNAEPSKLFEQIKEVSEENGLYALSVFAKVCEDTCDSVADINREIDEECLKLKNGIEELKEEKILLSQSGTHLYDLKEIAKQINTYDEKINALTEKLNNLKEMKTKHNKILSARIKEEILIQAAKNFIPGLLLESKENIDDLEEKVEECFNKKEGETSLFYSNILNAFRK